MKMRVYMKKLCIIGIVCVLVWLIMLYSSMIDIPPSNIESNDVENVEKRIDILRQELDNQMEQTNHLQLQLEKLKLVQGQHKQDVEKVRETGKTAETLVLPVLVIACDRVTVARCLDNLIKYRPDKNLFPIIVSQDCKHNRTYQVIKKYVDRDPSIRVIQNPDQSAIMVGQAKVKFSGYYKIARHFKFALNFLFNNLEHEAVIIVEDDLDISPDFFEYFLGTYPLLKKDPSLWCISAWNDNGKRDVIDLTSPELLHRTDFFPGLGWMIRKHTWELLAPNWPPAFFDDWLRNPANTEGKACIRPEISRTYTFGKIGVSQGLFYDNHLKNMVLNTNFVEFTKMDLSYLLKETYDTSLSESLEELPTMSVGQLEELPRGTQPVRLTYSSARDFQHKARALGLMDDFRSGVPRTAYRGIVTCLYRGRRVYLSPDFHWEKYDPSWG